MTSQNGVHRNGVQSGALKVAGFLGLLLLLYATYRLVAGAPNTYEHETATQFLSATYLVLFSLGLLLHQRDRRRLGRWILAVGLIAGVGSFVLVIARFLS